MAQKKPSWKKIIISPVCQNDLTRATESQEKQDAKPYYGPNVALNNPPIAVLTQKCNDGGRCNWDGEGSIKRSRRKEQEGKRGESEKREIVIGNEFLIFWISFSEKHSNTSINEISAS